MAAPSWLAGGATGPSWTRTPAQNARVSQQINLALRLKMLDDLRRNGVAARERKGESFMGRLFPEFAEDIFSGIGKYTGRTIEQAGGALIQTPGALYGIADALAKDVFRAGDVILPGSPGTAAYNALSAPYNKARVGSGVADFFGFPQSKITADDEQRLNDGGFFAPKSYAVEQVFGIGKGMAEHVRHPGRNPGYLALDIAGFASLGAAGGAGALRGARVLKEGFRPEPRPFEGNLDAPPTGPPPGPGGPITPRSPYHPWHNDVNAFKLRSSEVWEQARTADRPDAWPGEELSKVADEADRLRTAYGDQLATQTVGYRGDYIRLRGAQLKIEKEREWEYNRGAPGRALQSEWMDEAQARTALQPGEGISRPVGSMQPDQAQRILRGLAPKEETPTALPERATVRTEIPSLNDPSRKAISPKIHSYKGGFISQEFYGREFDPVRIVARETGSVKDKLLVTGEVIRQPKYEIFQATPGAGRLAKVEVGEVVGRMNAKALMRRFSRDIQKYGEIILPEDIPFKAKKKIEEPPELRGQQSTAQGSAIADAQEGVRRSFPGVQLERMGPTRPDGSRIFRNPATGSIIKIDKAGQTFSRVKGEWTQLNMSKFAPSQLDRKATRRKYMDTETGETVKLTPEQFRERNLAEEAQRDETQQAQRSSAQRQADREQANLDLERRLSDPNFEFARPIQIREGNWQTIRKWDEQRVPDEQYKRILGAAQDESWRRPLEQGETWRDRAGQWLEEQNANVAQTMREQGMPEDMIAAVQERLAPPTTRVYDEQALTKQQAQQEVDAAEAGAPVEEDISEPYSPSEALAEDERTGVVPEQAFRQTEGRDARGRFAQTRGTGESLREQGLNPREMGEAPSQQRGFRKRDLRLTSKQLRLAGFDAKQGAKIQERMGPRLERLFSEADGQPDMFSIGREFKDEFGIEQGYELWERLWGGVSGGTHNYAWQVMKEAWKAAWTPPPQGQMFALTRPMMDREASHLARQGIRETATTGRQAAPGIFEGVQQPLRAGKGYAGPAPGGVIPWEVPRRMTVDVPLSNNLIVRRLDTIRLGFYQRWLDTEGYRQLQGQTLSRTEGAKLKMAQRKFDFEAREISRIMADWRLAFPDMQEKVQQLQERAPVGSPGWYADWIDTLGQLGVIGLLYTKPAYLFPNVLGALTVLMADHAWNPVAVMRNMQIQREMFSRKGGPQMEHMANKLHGAMQTGNITSQLTGAGRLRSVEAIHKTMGGWYNRFMDTPFRENAFINEARRAGYRSSGEIERLMSLADPRNPSDPATMEFLAIARRANRNAIDFGRLSPGEKKYVRRVILFYPWIKNGSLYAMHWMAEHPAQAVMSSGAASYYGGQAADALGPVPSYAQGIFPVPGASRQVEGVGQLPKIINPRSFSVLGMMGETAQVLKAWAGGGVASSEEAGAFAQPWLRTAMATVSGQDLFTGRDYPRSWSYPHRALESAKQYFSPLRLLDEAKKAQDLKSGNLDPARAMYVPTELEAASRYLYGLGARTYNPKVGQEKAFSEVKGAADPVERTKLIWKDYRDKAFAEARNAGFDPAAMGDISKAFGLKADRETAAAALKQEVGHDLSQAEKLQSELRVLISRGIVDDATATQWMESLLTQADEGQIRNFRRRLGDAYFGGSLLSNFKKQLQISGVKTTGMNW